MSVPTSTSLCTVTLIPAQREERSGMGEVEMLPWEVTPAWNDDEAACDAAVGSIFKQAGAHLPCEEEAGRKLSHSFLTDFPSLCQQGRMHKACRPSVA